MQRVMVACVGKLKERFYIDAAAEYVKRLSRYCKLELIELPEQRLPESPSPAEIARALSREAEAIRALAEKASNETAVRRRYDALSDQLDLAVTMLTLAMIRSYQDTGDQALAEEMAYATLLCTDMQDAYILLGRDVLSSPCGSFLRQRLTAEEIAAYLSYTSLAFLVSTTNSMCAQAFTS